MGPRIVSSPYKANLETKAAIKIIPRQSTEEAIAVDGKPKERTLKGNSYREGSGYCISSQSSICL